MTRADPMGREEVKAQVIAALSVFGEPFFDSGEPFLQLGGIKMALLSARKTGFILASAAAFLLAGAALAANALNPPIIDWSPPQTWSPHRASRGLTTQGDISFPALFVSITACRQFDSRNTTPLLDNTPRAVTVTGAPCGIPLHAVAAAVNITVFDILGQGGNAVFKVGTTSPPTTAWINYPPGQGQIGNAGVLALNTSGQFFAQVNQGGGSIDFTVDVYGYYLDQAGTENTPEFVGINGNTGTSFGGLLFVDNASTGTSAAVSAVRGQNLAAPNGAAILGESFPTTATSNGVRGSTSSDLSNAAGILGTTGYTFTLGFSTSGAGVRGQGRNGVVGVTSQTTGNVGESGVIGVIVPNGGGLGAFGYLGAAGPNKGVESIGDFLATGLKSFADPHPTDPSKMIDYVSLEGRESGTYFRGTASTIQGEAIITIPEDFRMVTDSEGLTVQLTPVGAPASMYVVSEDLNQIVVHSNRDVKFHYMVNGVRASFKDHQPIASSLGVFTPLSAESTMSTAFSPEQRKRLIANGTYNADGTANLETARKLGWNSLWEHPAQDRPTATPGSNSAN
jgi:hypothetical protein